MDKRQKLIVTRDCAELLPNSLDECGLEPIILSASFSSQLILDYFESLPFAGKTAIVVFRDELTQKISRLITIILVKAGLQASVCVHSAQFEADFIKFLLCSIVIKIRQRAWTDEWL